MKRELTLDKLQVMLQSTRLDNSDSHDGIALLAIVSRKSFLAFHIPGALCVTPEEIEQCQESFERNKRMVVYSTDSVYTRAAADHLKQLGFRRVYALLGSETSWKASGLVAMAQRQELTEESEENNSIAAGEDLD